MYISMSTEFRLTVVFDVLQPDFALRQIHYLRAGNDKYHRLAPAPRTSPTLCGVDWSRKYK